jgi:hypothetical protein
MAWTRGDLDQIDAAIKENKKSVTFADGRQVTYQDVDKMLAVRRVIAAEVTMAEQSTSGMVRRRFAAFRSGV